MKTLFPLATPQVASRTRGKTVPHGPPVMPLCVSQSPFVVLEIPEPPLDPVAVPGTHTASTSPGPKNSPSSPPLDENWSLVFTPSRSLRATYSRTETPFWDGLFRHGLLRDEARPCSIPP
ncbi:hypothetical protein JTE90_002358 [Oedothorax gibbosus]|uniref:Uncharacterized protein n=1 Tax=Oedothorax gibbosus TaxID=931172 RepID=A0AAV6UJT6_9ARAC|nr:hypothetical protein JTE90_002358 [Oedothorax gibbosus]